MPPSSRRAGIVAARSTARGRGTESSTATQSLSAAGSYPLNEGCSGGGFGALERHEQPAVRALEAGRAGRGLRGEQLGLELLPAVRADDAVFLGHEAQA